MGLETRCSLQLRSFGSLQFCIGDVAHGRAVEILVAGLRRLTFVWGILGVRSSVPFRLPWIFVALSCTGHLCSLRFVSKSRFFEFVLELLPLGGPPGFLASYSVAVCLASQPAIEQALVAHFLSCFAGRSGRIMSTTYAATGVMSFSVSGLLNSVYSLYPQ